MSACTEACRAPVYCSACGRRKKPTGRDSLDNGLCSHECSGYREPPEPGHLWPSEPLAKADYAGAFEARIAELKEVQ